MKPTRTSPVSPKAITTNLRLGPCARIAPGAAGPAFGLNTAEMIAPIPPSTLVGSGRRDTKAGIDAEPGSGGRPRFSAGPPQPGGRGRGRPDPPGRADPRLPAGAAAGLAGLPGSRSSARVVAPGRVQRRAHPRLPVHAAAARILAHGGLVPAGGFRSAGDGHHLLAR